MDFLKEALRFGVLAFIFFLIRVPETKGRSLEQIASDLGADQQQAGHGRRPLTMQPHASALP